MPIDVENGPQSQPTPLPWGQLLILLFTQLAEPITSQLISPFAPQLVRDTGITKGDETKVGYYVGILYSLFFVMQALTVLLWSGLSDHLGRKPILLLGLSGISISMWSFGLSKTYWAFVISRCISGALNGNIGVLKSMMTEITDSTNIAQAFAFSPLPWSVGATLGPIIGGALAQPAFQYPRAFGNNHFFKTYPYFLPVVVPAIFSAVMWLVVFFSLKETVKNRVSINNLLRWHAKTKAERSNTPTPSTTTTSVSNEERPLPLRALLTTRVIITAANYSFLALCDLSFTVLQPVFLSTPRALGGLGLGPTPVGLLLTVSGLVNAIFRIFFFAPILRRFGARKVYLTGTVFALLSFTTFPILSTVARRHSGAVVWVLAVIQTLMPVGVGLSFVTIYIYVQAASPNRASLGATNGLCQVTVSIFRAVGPAAANSLYSLSIAKGYLGGFMVYYVFMLVAAFSIWLGIFLPRNF